MDESAGRGRTGVRGQSRESGEPAGIQSVGDGDGGCSGKPEDMAVMFDRLRAAAAAHDGE